MTVVLWTSKIKVPGNTVTNQPRVEIGHYFLTLYYNKFYDKNDYESTMDFAKYITSDERLHITEKHPHKELAGESKYIGARGEMHDTDPILGHVHLVLKGTDRDKGLKKLGLYNSLIALITEEVEDEVEDDE